MKKRVIPEKKAPAIEVADNTALKAIAQYRREYLIDSPAYKLECLK
jgi:hypothetical protein